MSVPWTENVTLGDVSRLLPEVELRETDRLAGVHSRTGIQASLTYFVLKYLGYDATLYDGSSSEWSAAPETLVVESGIAPLQAPFRERDVEDLACSPPRPEPALPAMR